MDYTTIDIEATGKKLKRLIKESNYCTQEKFAEAAGKDVRTVRRWIRDGINTIDCINEVAKALDVDVKALLF